MAWNKVQGCRVHTSVHLIFFQGLAMKHLSLSRADAAADPKAGDAKDDRFEGVRRHIVQ